jgi:hypothetical protein
MHETPPALFEALVALSDDVCRRAQEERLRAAGLRDSFRVGVARTPLLDRERRNQLLEADARAGVLIEVMGQLEELHDVFCPAMQDSIDTSIRELSTPRIGENASGGDQI